MIKDLSPKIAILLLFFISNQLIAQSGWEKGYIIDTRKDTLQGYIEYRNWFQNPDKIKFRKELSEIETTYAQNEISEFSVHGEKYVKATISVYAEENNFSKIPESPVPKFSQTSVLLLSLYEGEKNLYSYKSSDDRLYLYVRQGDQYDLLSNYKYLRIIDGRSDIVTSETFKQQLANYLGDCGSLTKKFSQLSYSEKSVGKLFESYYANCAAQKVSAKAPKETKMFQYGILTGGSVTKLKFSGTHAPDYLQGDFPPSYNFTGGGFINLIIARTKRRVSFYNDLVFTTYSTKASRTIVESENFQRSNEIQMGYSYLKMNSLIRYTLPVSTNRLFLNAGISNAYCIKEVNSSQSTTILNGNSSVATPQVALGDTRKYEQGIVFGAGYGIKNLSLEVRYERGNGMAVTEKLNSSARRTYLLFSYQF